MSLVSFKFILFLGMSFFVYFAGPIRLQWVFLLLFSYLYYYLSSGKLLMVLLGTSLFTYAIGLLIDRCEDKKKRKLLSSLGVAGVLGSLILIKYADFIITSINSLLHGNISLFHFLMPLGISYYTLAAIAYLNDIAKKRIKAEKNVLRFLLYMAYFPQIIQGPIPKYERLAKQLYERHDFDYVRICHGLQLMGWGIAKKIILADRLSVPVKYIFDNYQQFHGLFLFFGLICYGFQLYADFSGGIDAVRGISQVFGITLDDNFRQPYFSRSIEEFWRRWHISLGAWMREYVFYPLSLSKRLNSIGKKLRKSLGNNIGKKFPVFTAMFVVYLLVGIWHGADWKYAAYGIWNGVFIMSSILLEDQFKMGRDKLHINDSSKGWRLFQMLRTFLIVTLGRVLSRANSLKDAFGIYKNLGSALFDLSAFNAQTFTDLGISIREWILCLICVIVIMAVDVIKERGIDIRESIDKKNLVVRWTFYLLLIMLILVFGKYGPGYEASNFIYGNF
ncbi:MAG: MBOAT family protein [Erysipelotrichaceae bacterium]|nr:MBOAT family protein [Erysipelotrichaceae bacterium]